MFTQSQTKPATEKVALPVKTNLEAGCTSEDGCECYRTWGGQTGSDLRGYGECLRRCQPKA
jgi:hypothetical protein